MVEDWQRQNFESVRSSTRYGHRDGSKRCIPVLPSPLEKSSREILFPPVLSIGSVVGKKASCSTSVITASIQERRSGLGRVHSSKTFLRFYDPKSEDIPGTAGDYESMETSTSGILQKLGHVWDSRQCGGLLLGMAGAAALRLICPPLQLPILDILLLSHQQLTAISSTPSKRRGGGGLGHWRFHANLAFVALRPFCGSLLRRCLTTLFLVSHMKEKRNNFEWKDRSTAANMHPVEGHANTERLSHPKHFSTITSDSQVETQSIVARVRTPAGNGNRGDGACLTYTGNLHSDECCGECGCVVEVYSTRERDQSCSSLGSDEMFESEVGVKAIGDGEVREPYYADSDSEWEDVCLCSPKLTSLQESGPFTDDSAESCTSSSTQFSSTGEDGCEDSRRLFGTMDEGANGSFIPIAFPYPPVMGLRLQVPLVATVRSSDWCSSEQPMDEDFRYVVGLEDDAVGHVHEDTAGLFSGRLSTASLLEQTDNQDAVDRGGFFKRRGDKSPNSVLDREDEASSVEDYRLDNNSDCGLPESRNAPDWLQKGSGSEMLQNWDSEAEHFEREYSHSKCQDRRTEATGATEGCEDCVSSHQSPSSPRRRQTKCGPETGESLSNTITGSNTCRQLPAAGGAHGDLAVSIGRENSSRSHRRAVGQDGFPEFETLDGICDSNRTYTRNSRDLRHSYSSSTTKPKPTSPITVRAAFTTTSVVPLGEMQRLRCEPLARNGETDAVIADDGATFARRSTNLPAASESSLQGPDNCGAWEVVPDDPFSDHPTCIDHRQRRHSHGDQTYLEMRELLQAPWGQLIFWHGRCNEGRPTLCVMLGKAVRQVPSHQLKDFIAVTVSHLEYAELNYIKGSTKQINILMDLEGLGLMRLPPMHLLSSIGAVLNRDYAGRGGWLILVNAPVMLGWVIGAIQGVIFSPSYNRGVAIDSSFRGFLEGKERIMMMGSRYRSSLQSQFQASVLPVDLGGECPCSRSSAGGGSCSKYGFEFLQSPWTRSSPKTN